MTRKTFYSLMHKDGITGVKKQNGYKMKVGDIKIYLYQTESGTVHFIDPSCGMSIYSVLTPSDISNIETGEGAIKNRILEELSAAKEREEYHLQYKIFKKYKKARIMDEKYSRVIKEIQKKRRDKS